LTDEAAMAEVAADRLEDDVNLGTDRRHLFCHQRRYWPFVTTIVQAK
jgi:hypothetical protein